MIRMRSLWDVRAPRKHSRIRTERETHGEGSTPGDEIQYSEGLFASFHLSLVGSTELGKH